MFNRPEITAEWTVHAQVTIMHPGQEGRASGENSAEDGNVRVTCHWHGHSGDDSSSTSAVTKPATDSCGFSRGDMTFTAVPPSKSHQMSDSGYTSEKPVSSSVYQAQKIDSSEKKCRSTCNITLEAPYSTQATPYLPCRRAFSLRCPQNTISEHSVVETVPRRAHTFTTHFCTDLPDRKVEIRDAASQTTPIGTEIDSEDERKSVETIKRKNRAYGRRRHETDSAIASSRNSRTAPRRLCRSPASKLLSPELSNLPAQTPIKINGKLTQSPQTNPISKSSEGNSSSDSRKPRTVHIDVYCTGSEVDDDNLEYNSTNSENDESISASSPQTVFESEQVRVSHKKMSDSKELPRAIMMRKFGVKPSPSSGYPSMASSSSTIAKGLSASTMSSLMNSGSRIGYSSVNTSWKDTTTSDMESLINSASNSRAISMDPSVDSFDYDDSLDKERIKAFDKLLWIQSKTWKSPKVERKLLRSKANEIDSDDSNDEEDEETTSWIFSKNSDDSPGSIIIKEKDLQKSLQNIMSSQVSSIDVDDKSNCGEPLSYYNIHEEKFDLINTNAIPNQEILSKLLQSSKIKVNNYSETVPDKLHTITEIKKSESPKNDNAKSSVNKEFSHRLIIDNTGAIEVQKSEKTIEKESSRATSPFVSTLPGYFTDHLERARHFGNVLGTLKKPGHHVGPAKNPNCTCEHCKRWVSLGGGISNAPRGRAFSFGSILMPRPVSRRDSKRNTSEELDSVCLGRTDL